MCERSWEPQKVHLLARAIWIVLAWPGFTFELPLRRRWISFDFLGFLRPNRDFSMGYGRSGARNIFRCLSPQGLPTGCAQFSRLPAISKDGNVSVRDVHEFSLGDILIFRKQLTKNDWSRQFTQSEWSARCDFEDHSSKIRTAGVVPWERRGLGDSGDRKGAEPAPLRATR
jgi:hypothetical protein